MKKKTKRILECIGVVTGIAVGIWAFLGRKDEETDENTSLLDSMPNRDSQLQSTTSIFDEESLEILTMPVPRCPHEVSRHLRNLPAGWHASDEKRSTAEKNGFILGDCQTWVDKYSTGSHEF